MAKFVMPTLGADMTEGKLLAWRKKVGDFVHRGDIIADVETDKANIEVEVFATGVIETLVLEPGQKVPVGTLMAIIRQEGEPAGAEEIPEAAPAKKAVCEKVTAPPAPIPTAPPAPRPEGERIRISPAARKAAEELGIDPAAVTGTGPGGRITLEDVQRSATAKAAPVAKPEAVPAKPEATPAGITADRYARMRQVIADAMARSKREIPHYYLSTTIDMTRALDWLTEQNTKRPIEQRLLYGVLLVKAVALALHEVPELNSTWINGLVVKSPNVNVGMAISLRQGGLIAPALLKADSQSVDELMTNFLDLVKRARAGSLRSSELSDSTITVTSLGDQGVETVFGIIYPPQVALVGFGKVTERPWCVGGQTVSRRVISASLSGDHRVTDGHRGGVFLAAVDRLLQSPEKL